MEMVSMAMDPREALVAVVLRALVARNTETRTTVTLTRETLI